MKKFKGYRGVATALSTAMLMNGVGFIAPLSAAPVFLEELTRTSAKFNFGLTSKDGYINITSDQVYNKSLGYGFSTEEYLQEAKGWVNGVYSPRVVTKTVGNAKYIRDETNSLKVSSKVWKETESTGYGVYTYENTSTFDIDLESKDYKVIVELSNPTSESISVYLEAEDMTKVSGVEIKPGETKTCTFTSCLVDGQLNLKFLASSNAVSDGEALEKGVYVSRVEIEQITRTQGEKPTIFIASDSTVQSYEKNYYPQTGWGQVLFNFFKGSEQVEEQEAVNCDYSQAKVYETDSVIVENRAIGGRSSKSFIEEGKIDDLLEDVRPGDFVLVQWGHNDATASRPNRYVSSQDFEKYIQYYIDGAQQRGATCVLVTPVARRSYDASGNFKSDFDSYRQIMLKMGKDQNVPVLDLTQASIDVCNKFGVEGSKSLFLWLNAGDYPGGAYAGGVSDSTHLQYYGAYKFAQCVAELIQDYSTDNQLDRLKSLVQIPNNFTDVPDAPTGLETTTIGASSISLKWNKQDDAELYYIYRAELKEGQRPEDIVFLPENKYSVSSTPKYTDSSCIGGNTYVYAVAGFNEKGVGKFSDILTVATKSSLYRYDFCQDASNPTAQNWVSVHSKQNYTKEMGYGWIKAPGNGRYRANNGNADSNAMTDDFCLGEGEFAVDLPNGEYEVRITACDLLPGTSTIKPAYTAEGLSIGGISTKQAAGTLSASVKVVDGQLNLGVGGANAYINGLEITPIRLSPTGFTYQELSFNGDQANFLLNWNDVSEAVAYKVYQKASLDEKFTLNKMITQEEKNNAITLPFVADLGETMEYYVTAIFEDGVETPPSQTIQIEMIDKAGTPPSAPTGLSYVSVDAHKVELQWNAVDKAIKYMVYRSDREEGQVGYTGYQKIGETKGSTFTDETVTTNINWYYKVLAVNAAGSGELSASIQTPITTSLSKQPAEILTDRALVAIHLEGDKGVGTNVDEKGKEGTNVSSAQEGVYLSWRLFEADPDGVSFTLYKNGSILEEHLTNTNYLDKTGTSGDTYEVVGSSDHELGLSSKSVVTWQNHYLELTLDKPEDQIMPDGTTCTYTANDMSVADLNGDGKYELIVKWYPSNAQDNSKGGYTGTTILDAYDIDINTGSSKRMWRIDLGINIRSGAHYTQFQAWDLDGDGKAEIACKTADGTKDGKGNIIGDASADYRSTSGYVLNGSEYFTVFSGETGEALDTVEYIPARGNVSAWGDAYGNRVDRFLSCIAYVDGKTPSFIAARGYYTRTCLTAYNFKNGKIETTWIFDSDIAGKQYEAQGNHGISVADIDGDEKDEIIYGALVIDHDGTVKYSTGLGHGDAMHVSDWVPSNPGLEVMSVHEHADAKYQVEIRDAETGKILTGFYTGKDTGRGMAADIDPTREGAEFWSSVEWDGTKGGLYSSQSTIDNLIKLSDTTPSVNFSLYWDGDLLEELQDHTFNSKNGNYYPVSTNITKWDYENSESKTLLESSDILTSNGTKGNVGLVADIMGDWREEIIARTSAADDKIRIYSTTIETDYALPTLMDDDVYRLGVAWQNVAYNQPAHTSYSLSEGVKTAEIQVEDISKESITLTWSEASDGVYGHEIEGYNIYRYSNENGQYELLDTRTADNRTYKDENVEQNTTYSYKVASIVKGKESFRSLAVEATSLLEIASVPELEAVELVQGDSTYERFLPQTVTVIDKAGQKVEGIPITWDLKEFKISETGIVTLYGTIKGYEGSIPLTVTVVENSVVGFEDLKDIYTVVNIKPQLPQTLTHIMKDGTTRTIPVVWDTTSLDINQMGQYVITGKSELSESILLTVYVKENYVISVEKFGMMEVFKGTTPNLPTHVKATYADQTTKEVEIKWGDVNTDYEGIVSVTGTIEDYEEAIVIQLNIIKEPLYRFDFGISGSSVATGWKGVTVNPKAGKNVTLGAYSAELGYGFTELDGTALKSAIEGRQESYTYEGTLDKAVYTDFAIPDGKQFLVDLPNGTYTVQIVGGSAYKSNVKGYVEDQRIGVGNAANQYAIQTLTGVVVKEGQMHFTFDAGATSRMNAIIITVEDAVVDQEAPSFSYEGETTLQVAYGEVFEMPEVTATDNVDEEVVVEVSITNSEGEAIEAIDTTVAGTYVIAYTATDEAGNKATMSITVVILEKEVVEEPDKEAPSFNYDGEKVLQVAYAEDFKVPVVTATDNVDEEVVVEVSITNSDGEEIESINTTIAGTYVIKYSVTDKAGNSKSMDITVMIKEPLYLFDFGISSSSVASDWKGVTVNPKDGKNTTLGAYSAELGYGFTELDGSTLASAIQGRQEEYTFGNRLDKSVYADFAIPDGKQFIVDLPNGKYTVQIVGGSFYKSNVKGYVQGERISVGNAAGEYAIQTINGVVVKDGQMHFTFDTGVTSRMNAIMITVEEVEAVDQEAPSFSYEGETTLQLAYGEVFEVPVVTATDKVDGEVEVNVSITNSEGEAIEVIDTTVAGTYVIKYSAADQAGNSNTMSITVVVLEKEVVEEPDQEAPSFSYEGEKVLQVAYGEAFEVPVVTATDKVDGPIKVEVSITSSEGEKIESIDTTVAGTYVIQYTAIDKAGNSDTMSITVVVLEKEVVEEPDKEAPRFNYDGEKALQVAYGETFEVPVVTATDKVDGEVEVEVSITNSQDEEIEKIDTTQAGKYTVTYSATDAAGNEATMSITVVVLEKEVVEEPDLEAPSFSYDGEKVLQVAYGEDFEVPVVTATDNVDGPVKVEVSITSSEGEKIESIDTTVAGTYVIQYTAIDKAGNSDTMSITVVVLEKEVVEEPDKEAPRFNYDGEKVLQVAYGEDFEVPVVTATDNVDGPIKVEVSITNSEGEEIQLIDTTQAGKYTITYSATDAAGNSETMSITVIVLEKDQEPDKELDQKAPSFSYEGAKTIQVAYGETFEVPEVKAYDEVDGEVAVDLSIINSAGEELNEVNTAVAGTYKLIYQAVDQAGNISKLTITVIVQEKVVEQPDQSDDDDDYETPSTPNNSAGNETTKPSVPSAVEVVESALKEDKNPVVEVDQKGQLDILNTTIQQIIENGKQLVIKANDVVSISISAQTLKEQGDQNMSIQVAKPGQEEIKKVNAWAKASESLKVVGQDQFVVTVKVNESAEKATTSFTEPVKMSLDLSKEKINTPSKLVAVRYEVQPDGTMKAIKIGGTYDIVTGQFNFLTDTTGTFGLVEAENLVKINLVSNVKEAIVNEEPVQNDVAPIIVSNRVMLPVRFIAESLGAEVGYKKGKVTITLDEKTIEFKVGEDLEEYNVKPFIENSRTYISARWIAESFGAHVLWIPSTNSVQIVK